MNLMALEMDAVGNNWTTVSKEIERTIDKALVNLYLVFEEKILCLMNGKFIY